ncbi:hypothetical protein BJF86_04170 [Serinicoccus sp. CNJ-927]|nr:hypothetical protein BJF86_04170 [Serinicoccus sp. CNJ-927]
MASSSVSACAIVSRPVSRKWRTGCTAAHWSSRSGPRTGAIEAGAPALRLRKTAVGLAAT